MNSKNVSKCETRRHFLKKYIKFFLNGGRLVEQNVEKYCTYSHSSWFPSCNLHGVSGILIIGNPISNSELGTTPSAFEPLFAHSLIV